MLNVFAETRSVLVIEDNAQLAHALIEAFRRSGWRADRASTCEEARALYCAERPDVVILDLDLPDCSGVDLLSELTTEDPDASCMVLSGTADVGAAVAAMHAGARTVVQKPAEFDYLHALSEKFAEATRLRRRRRFALLHPGGLEGLELLGSCARMRRLADDLLLMAPGRASVLLQGETGTGKGFVARLLHQLSPRTQHRFVELSCAGFSPALVESELFGHEKGAFTDARNTKRGLLEIAHRGTLFLDEVGELPIEIQPRLLKGIEEQRFRRVGGVEEHAVDVRIVLASNVDLADEVEAGRFRRDLYYRLAASVLRIPPLRERDGAEIDRLALRFLVEEQRHLGRGPQQLTDGALAILRSHDWPGNVRELRSVVGTAFLRAIGDDMVEERHVRIPGTIRRHVHEGWEALSLREVERRHIARVLVHVGGNRLRAARVLGVTRTTLYRKMADYGLEMVGKS